MTSTPSPRAFATIPGPSPTVMCTTYSGHFSWADRWMQCARLSISQILSRTSPHWKSCFVRARYSRLRASKISTFSVCTRAKTR